MSHSLTLDIPDELYDSLAIAAKRAGSTPEHQAIQWLAETASTPESDPLEKFIGAFESQHTDWADQHDEYIGKAAIHFPEK